MATAAFQVTQTARLHRQEYHTLHAKGGSVRVEGEPERQRVVGVMGWCGKGSHEKVYSRSLNLRTPGFSPPGSRTLCKNTASAGCLRLFPFQFSDHVMVQVCRALRHHHEAASGPEAVGPTTGSRQQLLSCVSSQDYSPHLCSLI